MLAFDESSDTLAVERRLILDGGSGEFQDGRINVYGAAHVGDLSRLFDHAGLFDNREDSNAAFVQVAFVSQQAACRADGQRAIVARVPQRGVLLDLHFT